jgi:RecA-family ATPase
MNNEFNKIKEEIKKKILPANEILRMEEKEQPFLLDKMIVEGSINAITSDSGKGKSLIMLKMVEAIVRGEDFLGEYPTKKSKTLVLDLEMSENDIIQRVRSVIQTDIEGLDFYACQTFNIENKNDFDWLCEKIKENDYKLIVFDTLSAIHDRDENSNSLMNQVNKKMIELTNSLNVTVLFLHHHRKAQKGDVINQSTSRGAGSIIDKSASQLLLDSSDAIFIKDGVEINGLKMFIQQFKKRQVEKLKRFAVEVFNSPFNKKTEFKWAGEEEEGESALKVAKSLILRYLEGGREGTMSCFGEIKGIPSDKNRRRAVEELLNSGILSVRTPLKGIDEYINDTKVRANTKIYKLKEKSEKEEDNGFFKV